MGRHAGSQRRSLTPAHLYTDSLLALDARTGTIEWFDQVSAHDVRDYDFSLPPMLLRVGGRSLVIGAGKSGRVIAWDAASHRRVWQRSVGIHRNDTGPLPARLSSVCPASSEGC